MSQSFRLAAGGRIDRTRPMTFTFDGRSMTGFAGDTLASALMANGVHLMGRSFKYHRPRGVVGAGVEEPNALVEIDRGRGRREPNLQATTVELFDGLVARSQNRWPNLDWDVGAINGLIAPLIPAGFYYKTFMWPASAWHKVFEPCIRRAAGLGRAPEGADPDRYASRFDHCEVLVVGAGPTGVAAALAASEGGARVILCDEGAELGGSLLSDPAVEIDCIPSWQWLGEVCAELAARPNVTVLSRTTAFHYGAQNLVGLAERITDHVSGASSGALRQRWRHVRAEKVVLATGAHERPIVFAGNDRPGVMLASAARSYSNRYAVRLGRSAVTLTRTDDGYAAAFDLAKAGVKMTILDLRRTAPSVLKDRAHSLGVEVFDGARSLTARGRKRVTHISAVLASGRARRFACDLVLMAGGWTPAVHLFSQSRGQVRWSETKQAYLPAETLQSVRCAGACRGVYGLHDALQEGFGAGTAAAGVMPKRSAPRATTACTAEDSGFAPVDLSGGRSMAFVDFQNDVTAKDVKLALREGYQSVEHLKRYTTTGMATDQGRTSNLNAMAIAGVALGVPTGQVGITTFRAPYTPVTFGTLCGNNRGETFEPTRLTPTHAWATKRGAVFEDVGLWKRVRYFPQGGEDMDAAVRRECRAVRNSAGIFDASPLGKVEVVGPDAATFMNRLYVNDWTRLGVGRCRYGVLLREDGHIFDDGVVGRLAMDRFHVTTTSGGAGAVLNMMEDYLQTEWSDLKVWLTSVTEQWAVISLQGPCARDILAPLVEGIDLSRAAFPHMAVREGLIAGVPTRLFRVSFTGELGFEVNVPSSRGGEIWEAIWAAGKKYGAAAYGTEAAHVLRAEKGYIMVGQETDGTVTPDDVGLNWTIGKTKPDFVGKRSLELPHLSAPQRKQLVGLLPVGHRTAPDEGAQLLAGVGSASEGRISSAYWSDAVGGPIALGLLRDGRKRHGEIVLASALNGAPSAWRVGAPVFYDHDGGRIHG